LLYVAGSRVAAVVFAAVVIATSTLLTIFHQCDQ
jgi:hypothetical protein